MIDELIDKQDNVERIRDKIGQILLAEVASQKALAVAAAEDPRLWDLRVYTDRTNPWSEFIQDPNKPTGNVPDQLDATPIVNIFFDNENVDASASNVVRDQTYNGIFNIDCYGYGVTEYATSGHIPGDYRAQVESLRATRLVRNILMAGTYTYLDLRGIVSRRMVQTIESFRPPQDERGAQQVQAHRISLAVRYREEAPQVQGDVLEEVSVEVRRKETGEIYLTATFDTT